MISKISRCVKEIGTKGVRTVCVHAGMSVNIHGHVCSIVMDMVCIISGEIKQA